jgi:hypothetical protein
MFDPEVEMLAVPAATVPPLGSVFAAICAYAGLRSVHGTSATPTAKASERGCVRRTRRVRAFPFAVLTAVLERVLRGLVRFVVAMVLSCQPTTAKSTELRSALSRMPVIKL